MGRGEGGGGGGWVEGEGGVGVGWGNSLHLTSILGQLNSGSLLYIRFPSCTTCVWSS